MKTAMRVGEPGLATGVDVQTISYYEWTGLLPAPAPSTNGYRAYGPVHLELPAFIRPKKTVVSAKTPVRRRVA